MNPDTTTEIEETGPDTTNANTVPTSTEPAVEPVEPVLPEQTEPPVKQTEVPATETLMEQTVASAPFEPVATTQPVQATTVQPAQPSYVAPRYSNSGYSDSRGLIGNLGDLFRNPEVLVESLSQNIGSSVSLVLTTLAALTAVSFIASLISTLSSKVEMTGKIFGQMLKGSALSFVFSVIFIALLAGIVFVFGKISQKNVDFKSGLAVAALFSVNFLASAVVSVIGLFSTWIPDASKFISLLTSIVSSLGMAFSVVIIISAIVKMTQFSFLKATAVYVVTSLVALFLVGQLYTSFGSYFSVSFGSYSGNGANMSSISSLLNNLNDYLRY